MVAYAVRKQDTQGGPYYARRCNGYGQTTASSCCVGGSFVRASDCCNLGSQGFAWFDISKLECGATPFRAVAFGGRCWGLLIDPPLSEAQIKAQYPGERIFKPTAVLPCLDNCGVGPPTCPGCRDCIRRGFWRHPFQCCRPNNGALCECGFEWVYSWTAFQSDKQFDSNGLRTRTEATSSGSTRYRVDPDLGDIMVSHVASAHVIVYDRDRPDPIYYENTWVPFPTRGCGESICGLSEHAFAGNGIPGDPYPFGLLYDCRLANGQPSESCNCTRAIVDPTCPGSRTWTGSGNCKGGSGTAGLTVTCSDGRSANNTMNFSCTVNVIRNCAGQRPDPSADSPGDELSPTAGDLI